MSLNITKDRLAHQHKKLFGSDDCRYFFAPGRVNLIGEHIDYNGGLVLPCALSLGTYASVSLRNDQKIFMYSSQYSNTKATSWEIRQTLSTTWEKYPQSVFELLSKQYPIPFGLDIGFLGDLPSGAGLSSSASIMVLTATIIEKIYSLSLSKTEIAQTCQQAENQYIGVQCGIMDQFIIAIGKSHHAAAIDCNAFSYQYVPLNLGDYVLIIVNTCKQRVLAGSKYNERLAECQTALQSFQALQPLRNLADLTVEEFEAKKHCLPNDISRKRTKHVVYENQRVKDSIDLLGKQQIQDFGKKMTESHISLQNDYEVTGKELDILVASALEIEGVIGSRMTGAGFGGCSVHLVHKDQQKTFKEKLANEYYKQTLLMPQFYPVVPSGSAKEIS